jgi:putative membrane protein
MQKWLLKIVVCSVNAFILAYILPEEGVHIDDMFSALLVAIVLSVLDTLIKPLLILLTLPVTIITLGLFLLAINAFIILLDAHFVHGFYVKDFWWALLFSVLLSFFNALVNGRLKVSVHRNGLEE